MTASGSSVQGIRPHKVYNYFRDYDPATGTYIQSDPIGVRGLAKLYGVSAAPEIDVDLVDLDSAITAYLRGEIPAPGNSKGPG